jgi:hypothetical protein
MNKHEMSAIIGFWRMEVDDAVIANIIGCLSGTVSTVIKLYKEHGNIDTVCEIINGTYSKKKKKEVAPLLKPPPTIEELEKMIEELPKEVKFIPPTIKRHEPYIFNSGIVKY